MPVRTPDQFNHNGNLRVVQHLHRVTRELGWRELHGTVAVRMSRGHAFQLQTCPQTLRNEARLLLQDLHDTSTDIPRPISPT